MKKEKTISQPPTNLHQCKDWGKYEKFKDLSKALMPEVMNQNFHVSFVTWKGKVVAVGLNNKKTHPINLKNPKISKEGENVCTHKHTCSELNAFVKLKNLTNVPFHKCSLVNIRILKNGTFGNALPCQSCESLISYLNLKTVHYTDSAGNLVEYGE